MILVVMVSEGVKREQKMQGKGRHESEMRVREADALHRIMIICCENKASVKRRKKKQEQREESHPVTLFFLRSHTLSSFRLFYSLSPLFCLANASLSTSEGHLPKGERLRRLGNKGNKKASSSDPVQASGGLSPSQVSQGSENPVLLSSHSRLHRTRRRLSTLLVCVCVCVSEGSSRCRRWRWTCV